MAKKKTTPKKKAKKAVQRSKTVRVKKKPAAAKPKKAAAKRKISRRGPEELEVSVGPRKGLGARTGGQSGDVEGLSGIADADSESVEELLEEGQSFEADVVGGVENALDPDQSEVITKEVPEDDVPEEYSGE